MEHQIRILLRHGDCSRARDLLQSSDKNAFDHTPWGGTLYEEIGDQVSRLELIDILLKYNVPFHCVEYLAALCISGAVHGYENLEYILHVLAARTEQCDSPSQTPQSTNGTDSACNGSESRTFPCATVSGSDTDHRTPDGVSVPAAVACSGDSRRNISAVAFARLIAEAGSNENIENLMQSTCLSPLRSVVCTRRRHSPKTTVGLATVILDACADQGASLEVVAVEGDGDASEEDVVEFCKRIPDSLVTLFLPGVGVEAHMAPELASRCTNRLRHLDLSENWLLESGSASIAKTLSENLEYLSLRRTEIGSQGIAAFAANFPKRLTYLDISCNHIGREGLETIVRVLPDTIRHLYLGANGIGDDGALVLAAYMPPNLECLVLHLNEICDDGLINLCPNFRTGLRELSLYGNKISAIGARFMSRLIPTTLVALDFGGNPLGDEGVRALADGLPSTIMYVMLNNVNMKVGGARALARFFGRASDLQYLDIASNRISHAGLNALASNWPRSLRQLNLCGNQIGDIGARALSECWPPALQRLSVCANGISEVGARDLAQSLPKTLTLLNLACNGLSPEVADGIRRLHPSIVIIL